MDCPKCGETALKVIGSLPDCESVVRHRVCMKCGHSLYTLEYEEKDAEKEFHRRGYQHYLRRTNRKEPSHD